MAFASPSSQGRVNPALPESDCGCGGGCGPCASNFGRGAPSLLPPPELDSIASAGPLSEQPRIPRWVGTIAAPDFDIVLSAGPVSPDGARSCDPKNEDSCSLYRLRIRQGNVYVTRLRQSDGETGYIEPAVSPNGRTVAYISRSSTQPRAGTLITQSITGGVAYEVYGDVDPDTKAGEPKPPQWPDWVNDDELIFNQHFNNAEPPAFQDPRVFTIPATGAAWGTASLFLGSALGSGEGPYYSDVDVLHGDPHRLNLVSHRQAPPTENEYWSATAAVPASNTFASWGRQEVDFGGAWTPGGARLQECHHPSWSPSGNALVCHGHDPPVEVYDRDVSYNVRPLYRLVRGTWDYEGSRWIGGGRTGQADLFMSIPTVSAVSRQLSRDGVRLFPRVEKDWYFSIKYPRWARQNWLLATVFLQDPGGWVRESRIALIRADTDEYLDLVRFVEKYEGVDTGALRGFTATTASRSSVPTPWDVSWSW